MACARVRCGALAITTTDLKPSGYPLGFTFFLTKRNFVFPLLVVRRSWSARRSRPSCIDDAVSDRPFVPTHTTMPVCADCGVDKGKAQFAPSQRQRAAAKMQYPPRAETPDEAVRRWQAERRRRRHSHEPDSTLSMISEPTLITGDVSPGSKTPEQALEEHRRSRSIRGRSLSFDLPKVSEGGRLRTRPPARRTCLPTPIVPPSRRCAQPRAVKAYQACAGHLRHVLP